VNVIRGRHRRALAAAVVVGIIVSMLATTNAVAQSRSSCTHRVLILAAMPLELNPLVAQATLDPTQTVDIDGRTFYVGRLAGNDVVLAMSGIGLVNAEQTATLAFEHFSCRFSAAMFSGVAGSRFNIGDVTIPKRWTLDGGQTWIGTDAAMLRLARTLEGGTVPLARDLPVGDAACLCPGVDAPTPVHMPQPLTVHVAGDGESSDTFGNHAVPCLPGGGDIAGCRPCVIAAGFGNDAADFAANMPSLADPAFVQAMLAPPAKTTQEFDSQDEETANVAKVAAAYHVPFLGVRAVSDGHGDPLHLPGFPAQFFVYRQLAGNNAATVTIAFLQLWASKGRPT
jgi:nucleoside phosphorylase